MASTSCQGDTSETLNDCHDQQTDSETQVSKKTRAIEDESEQQQQQQQAMDRADVEDADDSGNVLDRLDDMSLTEEDTEMLLEEAYAVNRQLKEILRQQEKIESTDMIRRIPNPNAARSVNSKHNVLPPIKKSQASQQNDVYSARMPRPHQSTVNVDTSKSKSATSRKPSSSAHAGQRDGQKKLRGQKSATTTSSARLPAAERPEWNDRFSYT